MADYRSLARRAAIAHGLDPNIFVRQIGAESGFNPRARSPAGALGIAQIMPATARGWGVDPLDAHAALDAAAANMARYVKQFGNYSDALRAYNAGPGNVKASHGFAETNNYVRKILGGRDPGAGKRTQADTSTTVTTTTPGVDNSAARSQLLLSFLQDKGYDPVGFAAQYRSLADVPGTTSTRTIGGGSTAAGGSLAQVATQRANTINAQQLPYKWGGGHAGQTPINKAVPLDCSGAVSKVLGIDPRVADQFKTWGRPGDGGGKGVTIYSSPTHVLMKINGHFFGTSSTNPEGGAGWIPQGAISADYLSHFTARHSAR
jgi:hypothetical protein